MGGTWHVELGILGFAVGLAVAGAVQAARVLKPAATTAPWEPLCLQAWAAPAVFVAAAVGVFLAVPDTEAATLVLGLAVGVTATAIATSAVGRPWRFDSALPLGVLAIVWAAVSGTTGPNVTDAALIGAIATPAVMVLAPAVSLAGRARVGPRRWPAAVLVGLSLLAAVIAARVGAVRSTEGRAVAVSVAVWSVSTAVLAITARSAPGRDAALSGQGRPSR